MRPVAAAVAILLVGCGSDDTPTATVTVTKTVTVPATNTARELTPAGSTRVGSEQIYENFDNIELDGAPVRVRIKVRVSALRANVASPQYVKPQPGNKYVRIYVRLHNLGEDSYTPSAEFQAVTQEGDSNAFQSLGRPGDLGPAAIRPGRTARGRLWAEVPLGSTIDEIVFSPFGGDAQRDLVWSRK